MTIHRFQLRGPDEETLSTYTKHGAKVVAATSVLVDVDLADDSDLEDLRAYMESLGYVFVLSNPGVPL